ncbi:MAG TPA: hypothetical protein VGO58_09535 [Chitinophagaceae bacterium]|jgi:hypothetical protein|nr:hypothetical protein [Chitinophagaceae bacterium]
MKKTRILFAGLLFPLFGLAQNVGIGNNNPQSKLHINGGGLLVEGVTGNTPIIGTGVRFMWVPAKRALRAGEVIDPNWNDANIGIASTAFGSNTRALGDYSFAVGSATDARAEGSVAMGHMTIASGNYSFAMGSFTTASGNSSIAMGDFSEASGNSSVAMGNIAHANRISSLAIGFGANADGDYSIALGSLAHALSEQSIALGDHCYSGDPNSVAIGFNARAEAISAVSIGTETKAMANYSLAMGRQSEVYGVNAFASGYNTRAMAPYSIAMGYESIANGSWSMAAGASNKTDGNYSAAFGTGLIAKHWGGVVVGTYNDTTVTGSMTTPSEFNRLFQIGAGANEASRRNVMTVTYIGNVGIGVTNPDEKLHVQGDGKFSGDIFVHNNKGIVRSTVSTQQKILHANVTVNIPGMAANASTTIAVIWPESFSNVPVAFVGNIVTAIGGWAEVDMSLSSVTATGATLWIHNTNGAVQNKNFTVNIIAIGSE